MRKRARPRAPGTPIWAATVKRWSGIRTAQLPRSPDQVNRPAVVWFRYTPGGQIISRDFSDDPDDVSRARQQCDLALGVADLAAERSRLLTYWADIPEAIVKPGVITLLRLQDPDANAVTLWQDLLGARDI